MDVTNHILTLGPNSTNVAHDIALAFIVPTLNFICRKELLKKSSEIRARRESLLGRAALAANYVFLGHFSSLLDVDEEDLQDILATNDDQEDESKKALTG